MDENEEEIVMELGLSRLRRWGVLMRDGRWWRKEFSLIWYERESLTLEENKVVK